MHLSQAMAEGRIERIRSKTRKPCSLEGCDSPVNSRGLCSKHYSAARRQGDIPGISPCSHDGCTNPRTTAKYCTSHRGQFERYGNTTDIKKYIPCPTGGCGRPMHQRSPVCSRCKQLKWRYGLTFEKLAEMHEPENFQCSNPACDVNDELHVDHDHACCGDNAFETKQVSCGKCVRGWLCRGCNFALGFIQDNPAKLTGLVEYLNRYEGAYA